MKASLEPRPQSVELTLWGNLPQLTEGSGFPGLESAVVLHDSRAYDLDFTLSRGRVVVANRKASGPASVWVRLPAEAWELTLAEPGAEAALEIYGRWPRGVPFVKEGKGPSQPVQELSLLVLKGQVYLKTHDNQFSMSAPPGPALFRWDSRTGAQITPEKRDSLPDWATGKATPSQASKTFDEVIKNYQSLLGTMSPDAALVNLLAGGPQAQKVVLTRYSREFAIVGLAALDEIGRVAEALAHPNNGLIRSEAIVALRHWIGERPGRDQMLYNLLISSLRYTDKQAETLLSLLHSPFNADQTETYETLVAYLGHTKLGIRELAWWHLSRLVPENLQVPYNPAGPDAERASAQAKWKELLDAGKLPPK
jgi:hypothetical protein